MRGRFVVALASLQALLAVPLFAQAPPSPIAASMENPPTASYITLVVIYVLAIVSVPLLLLLSDLFKAYGFATLTRTAIIDKAAANDLTADELKTMLAELQKAPPGIPGLARGSLALTVLAILGVAIVHILVIRQGNGGTGIDQVLTLLGGVVATIIGFYFGGRTAESAAQSTQTTSGTRTDTAPSPPPTITDVQPRKAAPASLISVRGNGFGSAPGAVAFNGTPAASITRWTDSEIQAAVPREVLGFVEVTLTLAAGTTISAPPEMSITVAAATE